MHLVPEKDCPGHFDVLRGCIRTMGGPGGVAGAKAVGEAGARRADGWK